MPSPMREYLNGPNNVNRYFALFNLNYFLAYAGKLGRSAADSGMSQARFQIDTSLETLNVIHFPCKQL